jgi:release factor glutamine methyltransferase
MKLREALDRGEALLREGPHSDRARRDAETLLLHHIGKNKAWLMAHADEEFAGCVAIGYAALVERRRKGEPIQYITGECEFYGLPFRVTPAVLIPRPETEHLVEKALALAALVGASSSPSDSRNEWEATNPAPPLRILDVGTGSGAIGIALAVQIPNAEITAIDISESALSVARENAKRNGVGVRFLKGDLLAPVQGEQFDLILSNPPYVPNTDHALIAVEVREHEPAVALWGGGDGLEIYRRLIPAAYGALVPGGFIVLEMGFSQASDIQSILTAAGFENIEFTDDLQGIPRVISARRP